MDDRSSEVVAAGYVVERGRIAIASAPGRDVRAIGVSGGTIGAMDDSYRSHRLAGEIAVSGALAVDLGLGSYSYLAIGSAGDIATTRRVAAVFNPEPRAPRYSSVVATLVPGASVASECWVEFRPHMYEAGASALGSALTVGDEPVIVRRIVDPGYDLRRARVDLSMRSERFAWVVGGLIAGGLLWLLAWTRRSEFALLSALGWRTSHTAVLIQLENCYVVLAGATVGTLWAVLLAETANGPLLADQIAIGGRTALSLGLLSILIGGLATTTTRGGKATLALLKQE